MKFLRRILVITIAVLLVAVGVLVGRTMWQQHGRDLATKGLEFLPGVSQHIQDFHRVKVRDGSKVWEIFAHDAQYFDEDKTVVVRAAAVQLFLSDGRTVGLRGDEGRILLEGREITEVQLDGQIEVTLADYVVHTARATYYHDRQVISVPTAVDISGNALHLRGDRMEIDVSTQCVSLLSNVAMRIEPALLKGGDNAAL
jgi:LPS export ABC transporter protein LptC